MKDVDWNRSSSDRLRTADVILRMKDVDWNKPTTTDYLVGMVILRMKDVDWNGSETSNRGGAGRHPSYEGCGLKYDLAAYYVDKTKSSFVWRMWIEIFALFNSNAQTIVILRMKDVDWNKPKTFGSLISRIILRMKDVDWNLLILLWLIDLPVILRMKDVDWNWYRHTNL